VKAKLRFRPTRDVLGHCLLYRSQPNRMIARTVSIAANQISGLDPVTDYNGGKVGMPTTLGLDSLGVRMTPSLRRGVLRREADAHALQSGWTGYNGGIIS